MKQCKQRPTSDVVLIDALKDECLFLVADDPGGRGSGVAVGYFAGQTQRVPLLHSHLLYIRVYEVFQYWKKLSGSGSKEKRDRQNELLKYISFMLNYMYKLNRYLTTVR